MNCMPGFGSMHNFEEVMEQFFTTFNYTFDVSEDLQLVLFRKHGVSPVPFGIVIPVSVNTLYLTVLLLPLGKQSWCCCILLIILTITFVIVSERSD